MYLKREMCKRRTVGVGAPASFRRRLTPPPPISCSFSSFFFLQLTSGHRHLQIKVNRAIIVVHDHRDDALYAQDLGLIYAKLKPSPGLVRTLDFSLTWIVVGLLSRRCLHPEHFPETNSAYSSSRNQRHANQSYVCPYLLRKF